MSLFKFILFNLDVSKIFAKVSHPYVKFDKKHVEIIAKPVRPTVLGSCQNFVQKLGTESS